MRFLRLGGDHTCDALVLLIDLRHDGLGHRTFAILLVELQDDDFVGGTTGERQESPRGSSIRHRKPLRNQESTKRAL